MTDAPNVLVLDVVNRFQNAVRGANGSLKPCLHNALLLLDAEPSTRGRFRFSEFTQEIEYRPPGRDGPEVQEWRPLAETDITDFRAVFDPHCVLSKDIVFDAVANVAAAHAYHPVRAYLESLVWDEKPRLETLFTQYFVSDDTLTHREVGLRFAIGAVARVMRPGCKVDTLPVLEGKQGLFKSSGVAALVPDRKWFSDTAFDLNSKDAYQALHGIWIYEIGEMSSFSRAETARLKNFLSSAVDRYRPPYGRLTREFPRQCVFVGSTNDTDYIRDATGERRKWPVPVSRIDLEAIARDRDQIWAEALVKFRAGERWHLEGEAAQEIEAAAMERYVQDPWVEGLDEKIKAELKKNSIDASGFISNKDLYSVVFTSSDPMSKNHGEAIRLGRAMKALGAKQKVRASGGKAIRGWVLPESLTESQA